MKYMHALAIARAGNRMKGPRMTLVVAMVIALSPKMMSGCLAVAKCVRRRQHARPLENERQEHRHRREREHDRAPAPPRALNEVHARARDREGRQQDEGPEDDARRRDGDRVEPEDDERMPRR